MALKPTLSADGFATSVLRYKLKNQVQKAEYQLARYRELHGEDSAGYHARVKALNMTRSLYKGLCGDEGPEFMCGGRRG